MYTVELTPDPLHYCNFKIAGCLGSSISVIVPFLWALIWIITWYPSTPKGELYPRYYHRNNVFERYSKVRGHNLYYRRLHIREYIIRNVRTIPRPKLNKPSSGSAISVRHSTRSVLQWIDTCEWSIFKEFLTNLTKKGKSHCSIRIMYT